MADKIDEMDKTGKINQKDKEEKTMTKTNKDNAIFTVRFNDEDVELKVTKPTYLQKAESEKIRNVRFRDALKSGASLKSELKNELRERGQWSNEIEGEIKILEEKVDEAVRKLNEGGFEIEEAKELAFKIPNWRFEMINLLTPYADAVNYTAEGQADNAAFDYIVSCCAVYNSNGKPFFNSYEDYCERKEEGYAYTIASKVHEIVNGGISESTFSSLPEYQFLREFGFVDEKLRRVDEKGRLIDDEGRLISEDGSLINKEGKKVDRYGNLIGDDGKPILKRKPFLKDGKPVDGKPVDGKLVGDESADSKSVDDKPVDG